MFCFDRLTPKLMRTCQNNLKTYCHLPSDWSMKDDLSDNQVGMYLGCLYQQRQKVERIEFFLLFYFIFRFFRLIATVDRKFDVSCIYVVNQLV